MKTPLLFIGILLILQASAQNQNQLQKKVASNLIVFKSNLNNRIQQRFFIVTSDLTGFKRYLAEKKLQEKIISEHKASHLLIVSLNWNQVDSIVLPSPLVSFVDIVRTPKEENAPDGLDLSTNAVNLVHAQFKSNTGKGTVVSVKENRPDSNDIDLRGRLFLTALASLNMTTHATNISTIIAGAGNSHHSGRGIAWEADITSSNFASLLPDADADYKLSNVLVQNHSYGTAIENYYGADAAAYDASTISNPELLHVFSSGNSGDKSSLTGSYAGINGFANLTGSFKMAKNIITVGAIDSFYNISLLSSKGPAYDGRVRPELVAFGQDGTSGAAAIVSGTALLLQQAHKEKNGGRSAAAPLIKAILLNTADDVDAKGIDFKSGYGSVNAYKAVQGVINKQYFGGLISTGQVENFVLNVPANVHQLKVTICWNDVPAAANANKSLINDIDFQLVHAPSGSVWQPWVLNSFPEADSLIQLPVRARDSLNNTEQITIDFPSAGIYTVRVNGYIIQSGPQPYYISYNWDLTNEFKWQFPTSTDYVKGGNNNTLRWASTFRGTSGNLYYSKDTGNSWNLISSNLDLNRKYLQWAAPDTFSPVIFRMEINNQLFFTDTSTISSGVIGKVGFNCTDSFLIHWNKVSNISSYTLYRLGEKYLEPWMTVPDTSVIVQKSVSTSSHYAIACNIAGKSGIRSYTFNYTTQGVGCYIRNFLVDLVNAEHGNIALELGTLYNVREIIIEKWERDKFIPFKSFSLSAALQYHFTDALLINGGNRYRIRINLKDGQAIYSKPETIFYLAHVKYLVFPNPASASFHIVSRDPDDAELILYNTTGQKIFRKKISSAIQTIPVQHLAKGLYFVQILQKNQKVHQGSIVIQ